MVLLVFLCWSHFTERAWLSHFSSWSSDHPHNMLCCFFCPLQLCVLQGLFDLFFGPWGGSSSPLVSADDRSSAAPHSASVLKSSYSSCLWASFLFFKRVTPSCSAISSTLWASAVSSMRSLLAHLLQHLLNSSFDFQESICQLISFLLCLLSLDLLLQESFLLISHICRPLTSVLLNFNTRRVLRIVGLTW